MAQPRYHNMGTTADYAKVHGLSMRTAQKRISSVPGAVKTGRGWRVPILSTQYAPAKGISVKKARATAVKAHPHELVLQAQAAPNMKSHKKVPWKKSDGRNMFGGGRLSSNQYQYQGWAIVEFVTSGEVVKVWSHTIASRTALSYTKLDGLIRKSIARQLGTSPIKILAIGVAGAKSMHPWKVAA